MTKATSDQLRFPAIDGMSVRASFDGGAMSSDFGALLLSGVDRQTGLSQRLASSFHDRRHASYIDHDLVDLIRQRVYQQACLYEDGNDANSLRSDPMFKLAVGQNLWMRIITLPVSQRSPAWRMQRPARIFIA